MPEVLTNGKLAVSVLFDKITLEISCGDAYEAQTLFDEIVDRLQRGEGLTLGIKQPEVDPASDQK